MAKKKVSAPKVSQESKKPAPVKKPVAPKVEAPASKPKQLEITTIEDAKKHLKNSYPNLPLDLKYTVLSNGHVFYGINNGSAKLVAENYGLKMFEVQF